LEIAPVERINSLALIVVDMQNDFCPGGALPVKHGDAIIPKLNTLIELFDELGLLVVFTRDWHPKNHISFRKQSGPWPPHGIQNTEGAKFHSKLLLPTRAMIVSKGADPTKEAYSGFQGTQLEQKLRENHVKTLFVGGLATDYCVKNTVIDARKSDFEVKVITDCVRGVNVKPTDSASAFKAMELAGAEKTTADRVTASLQRRAAVLSSS
jgi:nicotinamidase/pyrazinamidase